MELVEYRPALLHLDRTDLNYLLGMVRTGPAGDGHARLLQSITPTTDADAFVVTSGPFVGRLGLPSGGWIDFRSRFPLPDVVELIRRSGRHPITADTLRVEAHADRFLIDAIALAYARELEHLVGRGLAKGYTSIRRQRPPHAGRIDVTYHVTRLAARPDQLATVSRRITTDIDENRALAAALDVLIRVPLAFDARHRLAALGPSFGRVLRRPTRAEDVARIPLTTMTQRYRPALALAEAILRSQSLAPRSAGAAGGSLLFSMPKVWEAYVADWLAERWPGHRIEAPYSFTLTTDGDRAEADATVWNGDQLVALYDAKYKWPTSAPDRADLYQMITYCERLDLPECTLVYPVDTPHRAVTVGARTVNVLGLRPNAASADRNEPAPTAERRALMAD